MAPLYNRYIPPKSTAEPAIQLVKPVTAPVHVSPPLKKRKRDHPSSKHVETTNVEANDRYYQPEDVRGAVNDGTEKEDLEHKPAGEFAHVRSTKKRHKLEKEARKAKKLIERAGGPSADRHDTSIDADVRTKAVKHEEQSSTGRASTVTLRKASHIEPQVDQEADVNATSPTESSESPDQQHENGADQNQGEDHLKKHQRILNKFEKSQRLRKEEVQAVPSATESDEKSKPPVRALEPFTIELDTAQDGEISTLSSLPPWLTAPITVSSEVRTPFSELGLDKAFVERLQALGYVGALPVQRAIVPLLLPPGAPGARFKPGTQLILPDLAVSAPTGSGKTLAYLLPLLATLRSTPVAGRLRGLIIVPTRELVSQVASVATGLFKGSGIIVGTASTASNFKDEQHQLVTSEQIYDPAGYKQATELVQMTDFPLAEEAPGFEDELSSVAAVTHEDVEQHRENAQGLPNHIWQRSSAIDVLVCTPGRLVEHINSTPGFTLADISWLIMDEADKLLDEQNSDFVLNLQHELTRPRKNSEQGPRERHLRQERLWNKTAQHRIRKVILSATMTRDVAQLAPLQLRRPQLIVLQGTASNGTTEEGESHDPASISSNSAVLNGEQYQLPPNLHEYCVPAGDGSKKPLHLVRLLEKRVLTRPAVDTNLEDNTTSSAEEDTDTSSGDDSISSEDDSGSSSESDDNTSMSSDDDTSSEESNGTDLHGPKPKLDLGQVQRASSITKAIPSVLVFTSSTEATVRLSHLLKHLLPEYGSIITTLTRSVSASDAKLRCSKDEPLIVIATDRAGRGLDTLAGRRITHVVQYDVPRSVIAYVHRVGRTARAGRAGEAWTLYTNTEARWFIKDVTKAANIKRTHAVERVRFSIDDQSLDSQYEKVLSGMKESVAASGNA